MTTGFSTAEYGTREYYAFEAALDFHGTTNGVRCCTSFGIFIHKLRGWDGYGRNHCRKCSGIDWLAANTEAKQ